MPFSQIWERYVGCYHSWLFTSEEILNTRTDCIFHEKMKVHRAKDRENVSSIHLLSQLANFVVGLVRKIKGKCCEGEQCYGN